MSKIAVGTIMGRAVTDREFCERLSVQPDEVLSTFDLSIAETEALKHLDGVVFKKFLENLTQYNKVDVSW